MIIKLRKIGNSQGIILPKEIIEKCQLQDEVEISVNLNNEIICRSPTSKRSSWEKEFKKAKDEGIFEDADLMQNQFDEEEWEW